MCLGIGVCFHVRLNCGVMRSVLLRSEIVPSCSHTVWCVLDIDPFAISWAISATCCGEVFTFSLSCGGG